MKTTSGLTSIQLLNEEQTLTLPLLEISDALEIGEIAKSLSVSRNLPVAIEVRLGDWIVYHASLPGSSDASNARGVKIAVGFQSAVNVPEFFAAIADGATGKLLLKVY